MVITIEKVEKNSLIFAYIWSGEPNKAPPVKEFHTSIEGEAGKAFVEKQAKDWIAAQQITPADSEMEARLEHIQGFGERELDRHYNSR